MKYTNKNIIKQIFENEKQTNNKKTVRRIQYFLSICCVTFPGDDCYPGSALTTDQGNSSTQV